MDIRTLIRFAEESMPRFDHRFDNQIQRKDDLRFTEQDTAEDFATSQYMADFIPRSVIAMTTGELMVLENPTHEPHAHEVFFINSMPGEG